MAIKLTNKTLKSSSGAAKDTTLMTSLLLDLFEKITTNDPQNNKLWVSHADGALSMVKIRGLDEFVNRSQICMLMRLITHYTVSCVASRSALPDNLITLHSFLGRQLGAQDTGFRMAELMFQYTNLCSKIRDGALDFDEIIEWTSKLDSKLEKFHRDLPTRWQQSTIHPRRKTEWNLDLHYDLYPDAKICQALNMHRVIRILLNSFLID